MALKKREFFSVIQGIPWLYLSKNICKRKGAEGAKFFLLFNDLGVLCDVAVEKVTERRGMIKKRKFSDIQWVPWP